MLVVLASKVWAGWLLCRGYPNGVGYVGFEAAGGCDLAMHERGSVLASEVWAVRFLGGGYPNGVGYIGFETAGGCNWVTCEGGLVGAKKSKN